MELNENPVNKSAGNSGFNHGTIMKNFPVSRRMENFEGKLHGPDGVVGEKSAE
jgi:hypothetical protein